LKSQYCSELKKNCNYVTKYKVFPKLYCYNINFSMY